MVLLSSESGVAHKKSDLYYIHVTVLVYTYYILHLYTCSLHTIPVLPLNVVYVMYTGTTYMSCTCICTCSMYVMYGMYVPCSMNVVHTKGRFRKWLLHFSLSFALSQQHLWDGDGLGALSFFFSCTLIKRRKFPHQPQHHVQIGQTKQVTPCPFVVTAIGGNKRLHVIQSRVFEF